MKILLNLSFLVVNASFLEHLAFLLNFPSKWQENPFLLAVWPVTG